MLTSLERKSELFPILVEWLKESAKRKDQLGKEPFKVATHAEA